MILCFMNNLKMLSTTEDGKRQDRPSSNLHMLLTKAVATAGAFIPRVLGALDHGASHCQIWL